MYRLVIQTQFNILLVMPERFDTIESAQASADSDYSNYPGICPIKEVEILEWPGELIYVEGGGHIESC